MTFRLWICIYFDNFSYGSPWYKYVFTVIVIVAAINRESFRHFFGSKFTTVAFTGSLPVGAKVAQRATSQIKKTVLELGGSDPLIVCEDADIEKASTGAVKGRFINCGQSCIASKRFIVTKKVANEFIEKFVQKTEKLKVGDPMSDDTVLDLLLMLKA